jgi:integrase
MTTQEQEVKRERGRGRLYHQRGSAFWWLAFYKHGKQIRMSTEETDEKKAERVLKLKLQERDAELGGGRKMITPQQQRITVSELLENLESDYRLRGIDSPQFRSHVKHIRGHFGHWRAVEITAAQVDRYIEIRLADGARPASINRSTQVFGQAFKLAVERGQLNSAPKLRHLSEAGNARQGFFAEREIRAVIENLPAYLKDFALFGFLVGWRKGEIASLAWADVDGDCIRLRPENSKNGEGRVIVLEGGLAELIERRQAARAVKTDKGTVFSALIFHNEGQPIVDTRKSWARACCMAGVGKMTCPACNDVVIEESTSAKRIKTWKCASCSKTWKYEELKYTGRIFHDLRRSSVRNMIRAGVPEKVAMTVSGHKTRNVFDRYNIVSESDLRAATRRTQDYLKNVAVEKGKLLPMPARVQ